jgi:hypothetical protein
LSDDKTLAKDQEEGNLAVQSHPTGKVLAVWHVGGAKQPRQVTGAPKQAITLLNGGC